MLRSMTAYVHETFITPHGRLTIEIQSLNKKHFELFTVVEKELSHYEIEIRKSVSNRIQRGKIVLNISLVPNEDHRISIKPNIPLVKALKKAWNTIQLELGIENENFFDASLLKDQENIFIYEDQKIYGEEFKNILFERLENVLFSFIEMKMSEGAFLYTDILYRLSLIESYIEDISRKVPDETQLYRKKIMEKLESLLPEGLQNDERVLREVCFFAERVDITEEIVRLKSHIHQFKINSDASYSSIGKKLEFLTVEMGREVNTIGSKTTNTEISHLVVDIKSEIEKIKEQLQNVE